VEIVESAKALAPWVAAFAALVGVILGGFINLGSQWFIDSRQHNREAQTLRMSLAAEINGMLGVIEARQYLAGLMRVPTAMTEQQVSVMRYSVKIDDNYCPIYRANAGKVGILDPSEAAFIVGFHQLIQSVIQDVTVGGVLYEGGNAEQYAETASLLQHAISMGKILMEKIEIPTEI